MIKLIATDLDGTLLNDDKKLPADFDRVLDRLEEKGVVLVAASGRDYNGAAQFFGDRAKDMMFVCDNGANIYDRGRLIQTHTIPRQTVHRILTLLEGIPDADPLLCSTNGSYITYGTPAFMEKMKNHYSPVTLVEDIHGQDSGVFKISVYDVTGDIRNHLYMPLTEAFGDELTIHISANIWVDIMADTADKGRGIEYIQSLLGATREQTMAFGDFYNDVPLLSKAKYAFVMDNANDDLKKMFPYRADDNNSGGVTKAIKEWVLDRE